jgi:hypothetical protein
MKFWSLSDPALYAREISYYNQIMKTWGERRRRRRRRRRRDICLWW